MLGIQLNHINLEFCYGKQFADTTLILNFFFSQETADLLDPKQLQTFKSWSGELRLLPNIKLRRYIKGRLLEGRTEDSVCPDEMEEDEDESNGEDDEDNEGADNMT